ncbi:MAG TPA: rhodanese-like domain-containing protein [Gammaproteobacteria bacterium]|jgi:rhodanese-related sulfurtransferase|nr:MAG: rhodanese-like domain-containing protein [Gammaproteobacteria bacterium TMED134]RZO71994.1 MAG: rhodanese-like domain-containing protein [OM182 bacterium]HAL41038.1 rhodanese-like domain-containing protein [Gammaproteobacteria bacterium]HBK18086.1 rhodanese-like domain-containing protein [Gammaproteobacteria bacterium]|tara:strand:- start:17 stop:433 length:417 start_codon:yes stop_codon:yes gene_type:complete
MEQFFIFIGNHPLLVGSFILLLILFIRNESVRAGATIGTQELVRLVNTEGAKVLDVREKNEFREGHIVDAVNIPFASLEGRLSELQNYRETPMIVACKMGQHSGSAGTLLQKNGFTKVMRLSGGYAEWRGQNLPVVKG